MSETHSHSATACVVGGGPAGAMLGLLLARAGIDVILLEKHADFLRDFRGDTVHPATLSVLAELGLSERFQAIPQRKVQSIGVVQDGKRQVIADFSRLDHPFPYIAFVPQWDFLSLLTTESARYPNYRLRMRAEAYELVREHGRVTGVRFRDPDGEHIVKCGLTVATDGRDSTLRRVSGIDPHEFGSPLDIVNVQISRRPTDPEQGLDAHMKGGKTFVVVDRGEYWHVVHEILKGGWEKMQRDGVQSVRDDIANVVPFLADRVHEIESLEDMTHLDVTLNRLRRWHQPGLLFIGDAAHAMSPVGGFGANLAVQDAVATAHLLGGALRRYQQTGAPIEDRTLDSVRRRRGFATAVPQTYQRITMPLFVKRMEDESADRGERRDPFSFLSTRPSIQRFMARMIGVGVRPEHVRDAAVASAHE